MPRVQLKVRGTSFPFHKHLEEPMSPSGVIRLVLVVEHLSGCGINPHKGNGVHSFQGSVKQDILEPAP